MIASLAVVGGVVLGVGAVIALIGSAFAYQYYVVLNPGPHLERDHIRSVISQESPVYYADGVTRVGVFFDEEHRQFVPYEELPQAYVLSIVAAEDGRFWSHWGIDPRGIARALLDNLQAGAVVAGGSTLTQQTAKNLYYRPDRSLRAKLVEFLNAAKLEAHYDKEEILEFYVNQFHVSGNGRGLGIAARHFFDKEVDELTLVESAFLAGLVKAPAYYDPYLGDAARRERAVTRAHDRTRYVLRRLAEEDPQALTQPLKRGEPREEARARLARTREIQERAAAALEEGFELEFKRGSFRFESSAVLDEVARRLDEPPFDEVLGEAGIESAETAGLHVITTLDPDAQREATYALWHHLTEVGAWMEAPGVENLVLEGHRGPRFDPDFPPRRHQFRVARVAEHEGGSGKRTLRLDLGGHLCIVDRTAVVRMAVAHWRGRKKDRFAKMPTKEVDAFVNAIPDDAIVLASVREIRDEVAYCDLEVRPELQGAVTVIQQGEVRAMVGGNDNRNFNRTAALRQFGSTWKPLVYHAALNLGWQPNEALDNERNVFPFSTTFYYPRPDHTPAPRVSLAWAGVRSENLASIWLLYHLMDRLTEDQIAELAETFGMSRNEGEDIKAYRRRIQEMGVLPTRARVEESLFLKSRQEVFAGIEESDHPEDRVPLQSLLYGWGFSRERNRASREGASTREWKLRALDNQWQTMHGRLPGCRTQYDELAKALERRRVPERDLVKDLTVLIDEERIEVNCVGTPEGHVSPDQDFLDSLPTLDEIRDDEAEEVVEEGADDDERRRRKALSDLFSFGSRDDEAEEGAETDDEPSRREVRKAVRLGPQLVEVDDITIDGRLHLSTLAAVEAAVDRNRAVWEAREEQELYDPEVLYWHQDFRVLLAMKYVVQLAEDYGVQTDIREVLAMPLGASEITLEEAGILYSGLVSGTAWEFPGESGGAPVGKVPTATLLIKEIRDPDGTLLYQATPEETKIAEPPVADMTVDILRNVVLHGTGRRAKETLTAGGFALPAGGKTGTTNDFKNAAFLGYVPVARRDGYVADGSFTIGVYVGYDDNRPMSVGNIRLDGSKGALPAWILTAQGLSDSGLLGEPPVVDVAEGEPWPLDPSNGMARMFVDPSTGLPSQDGAETEAMTLVRKSLVEQAPDLELPTIARPTRVAPSIEEAQEELTRRQRRRQERRERQAEAEAEALERSGGVVE